VDPVLHFTASLGATQERLDGLLRQPRSEASLELERLKKQARSLYRKLAAKYHPDRPSGDAVLFVALGKALAHIEGLTLSIPKPREWVSYQVVFSEGHPYDEARVKTRKGVTYDARRVAFMRHS